MASFPLSDCPLHLLGTKLFSASCTHSAGSCPKEAALPRWHLLYGNSRVRNGQRLPRVLHHAQKYQTRLLVFDNKQCMRPLGFVVYLILYFPYSCTSTHTTLKYYLCVILVISARDVGSLDKRCSLTQNILTARKQTKSSVRFGYLYSQTFPGIRCSNVFRDWFQPGITLTVCSKSRQAAAFFAQQNLSFFINRNILSRSNKQAE